MRLLIELFLVFVKIGFASFGGISMIPLINNEMLSHGWMTPTDVQNIVAIAEMTPGPLGINFATFAGQQTAGVVGGFCALMGALTPSFTTTLLTAIFYERFRRSDFMNGILYVVRPVCIGLFGAIIISYGQSAYLTESLSPDPAHIAIGITALLMRLKWNCSVILVICVSGLLGLALHSIGI